MKTTKPATESDIKQVNVILAMLRAGENKNTSVIKVSGRKYQCQGYIKLSPRKAKVMYRQVK